MKKMIIVLFCIPLLVLSADEVDPLDLGNVIIQGKTDALQDTLSSKRDLNKYCLLASSNQFEYKAYYSHTVIEAPKPYPDKNIFAFQFNGGLDKYTAVRGAIAANDLYNFSAKFYNHERTENWIERIYNLQCQPQINDHELTLDINSSRSTSEFGETEIMSGSISYNKVDLTIDNISEYNWNIDIKLAYHDFTQLEDSAKDLDISSRIGLLHKKLNTNLAVNMLKQNISGHLETGFSEIKSLNKLSLWCAYDNNGAYPSVSFSTKFNIMKNLSLRIENDPTITTLSRADGFKNNLLQSIFPGKFQTKKLLNSYLKLESNYILPLSIFYNASWQKDHLMYADTDDNGFYEQERIDCLIHRAGLRFAYEYGNFSFLESVEYKFSDDILYFEPLLTSSTKFKYEQILYSVGVALNLLSGGEDDEDKSLEDVVLVDVNALYKLRENISILAEVKNLLDQKYKRYNNYVADELQMIIGFRMLF